VAVGTAKNPPVQSVTVDLASLPARARWFASAAASVLGHAKVTVAAGAQRAIKVKLSKSARKTLQRRRQLRVQVRITAVDRSGHKVKATATRKLTAAKR